MMTIDWRKMIAEETNELTVTYGMPKVPSSSTKKAEVGNCAACGVDEVRLSRK